MRKAIQSILRKGPVVCAVGREYLIMVPVNCETLMSVTVGGREYFCHSNGVRRSRCDVQQFTIPMKELDRARQYTLHYQRVISRQAYACIRGRMTSKTYSFRPLTKTEGINVYVLSDCHGLYTEAVRAGSFFGGDLDLLILNGDVSSSCMTVDEALLPLAIAYEITKGGVPCVITRGNHDLRGRYSERLHELMPTASGKTYYPVCLGALWLLVLDCGEDKNDDHREYGGTAAYHAMRLEETAFLQALARDPDAGYRNGSVRHKLIVSHIPATYRDHGESGGERPFLIEDTLYTQWISSINDGVHPELYIAGHHHKNEVWRTDSEKNGRGLRCPVLITGKPVHEREKNCIGAALTFSDARIEIAFTDKENTVVGRETISIERGVLQ